LDLEWRIAEEVLMLSNIAHNRENPDTKIRMKHENTWEVLCARYPKILNQLEGANFHPRVFCPKVDWTESIKRAKEID
jgi:hypothetical protein